MKKLLLTTLLISLLAPVAMAQEAAPVVPSEENKVSGVRWGSRIMAVNGDELTVLFLMATGSCGKAGPQHGERGNQVMVKMLPGKSYAVGDGVEVFIDGTSAPTLEEPACLSEQW